MFAIRMQQNAVQGSDAAALSLKDLKRPDCVNLLSKLAKSIINWGGGLSLTLCVFLFRALHLAESVHRSLSSLQPSCSTCNLKQIRD